MCIDFIKLCPDDKLSKNTVELIIALLNSESATKSFYNGKSPTYSDVNLLLTKVKTLLSNNEFSE